MHVRIDDNPFHSETHMNAISSKLTALVMALAVNSLIMGSVAYLFEIQSHPHLSVMSLARLLVTHRWLI